jgi:RNA polymerase sigma factor (sigma-70 family)
MMRTLAVVVGVLACRRAGASRPAETRSDAIVSPEIFSTEACISITIRAARRPLYTAGRDARRYRRIILCRIWSGSADILLKMSETDLQLLERYHRDHAEEAFAELVHRHINLVYSAALRQSRSPQLAEEISQSVFSDLARNAGKLKPNTILTAWMYQVTRRTAIDVIRQEARRQLREQIATEMNAMNASAEEWTQIAPLLDEAMSSLDESERAVVLLRYFENKSLREVGNTLGISDDSAQKRVSRAVERLRQILMKRGVTVGVSGLAAVVSTHAVQAAPAGLILTISTMGVTATATFGGTAAAAGKSIAMTTFQKTVLAMSVAVVVGVAVYETSKASTLRSQVNDSRNEGASLAGDVERVNREWEEANVRLAGLRADNERFRRSEAELEGLRAEVARLSVEQLKMKEVLATNFMETAAREWLYLLSQLREYLEANPEQKLPEHQFVAMSDWLYTAGAKDAAGEFLHVTNSLSALNRRAEVSFAGIVSEGFRKFISANKGQRPTDLKQLGAYVQPEIMEVLASHYDVVPKSIIPEGLRGKVITTLDFVVMRKIPVVPKNPRVIYEAGSFSWMDH